APVLIGSPSRQHSAEIAAAEQMDMKMRNFLMRRWAGIGENPIARHGDAVISGNLAERADQGGDFVRRGLLGKIVEGDILPLWNGQDMGRRLRADVVKGKDVPVLVNLVA